MRAAAPGEMAGEQVPEAGPNPPVSDLLGRQPVRVRAEDGSLAAYGFGGQRVLIPAAGIGSAVTRSAYTTSFRTHGAALLVLDRDKRVLLRAGGAWSSLDLRPVLAGLGVRLQVLTSSEQRRKRPSWDRAPGYRRLRVRPRGFALYVLALAAAFPTVLVGGVLAGAELGVALPWWFGAVRSLIGIAGAAAGASIGLWLLVRGTRLVLGAIRWTAYSASARSPAPLAPFFPRPEPSSAARKLRLAALVLAVPALIGWGPGVAIATVVKGFSDQALVHLLRSQGVPAAGRVIDMPTFTTDNDGDTEIHHHPTLWYVTEDGRDVLAPDPGIGGRTWPMDPLAVVTVIYDPANADAAAVRGQLQGSPWHGAPTSNLISSALLTLALPFVTWAAGRRVTSARRAQREDFLDGIF